LIDLQQHQLSRPARDSQQPTVYNPMDAAFIFSWAP